ncbi:MAG: hypothetical protein CUN51_08400, partial [Candidatus Thermofonsia Clade 1 bacterium]
PSRNWLCVYLFEYYQIAYGWAGWRWLAEPVLKSGELEKLSLRAWSRFQSALGWAYIRYKPPQEIRRMQTAALARLKGMHMPFEEALHHIVLYEIERLALRRKRAIYHAESALKRLSFAETPFYAMRALWSYTDIYRVFGELDKAQALIDQLTDYAKQKEIYRTALGPHIIQGWTFASRNEPERAAACFQEAITFLGEQELVYEQARARHALGRLYYFVFKDLVTAEQLIREAIDAYYHESRHHEPAYAHYFGQSTRVLHMQAIFQNVLVGVIAERGQLAEAFDYELEALAMLKHVYDDASLYDVYTHLSILSRNMKKPLKALFYRLNAVSRHPVLFLTHTRQNFQDRLKHLREHFALLRSGARS